MKIIILLAVIIPLFILLPCCSKEADNSNGDKIIAMTIYPDHIFADNNEATYSEVRVTIETWDGAPAQGVEVSFEADSGSIQDIVYTDENGIALNKFNDDGISGTAYICANISSDQPECRTIEIRDDPHLTIAWITASPDTIYPDHGITSSEIEVSVKDQSGFPIPG